MSCSNPQLIEIDGSVLEGGGQILRMSVTLSALCGIAIKILKIRAGRSKPGLAAQHLKGLQLVRDMSGGRLRGAEIGSTEVEFVPGNIKGGEYYADTQTAGSISLLLQVALPCALFADSKVVLQLKGGTNAEMAPQIDFTTEVFRPNMEKFGGASFDLDLHKRGYFPRGGGHVTVDVEPIKSLKGVNMTVAGKPKCIHGWSYVAGTLHVQMSSQTADGAKQTFRDSLRGVNVNIESYKETTDIAAHNASGIVLVCETTEGCIIGGAGLGKRGIKAQAVGSSAAKDIVDAVSVGACVDSYTQDQLIILMALAEGVSSIRVGEITMHTKTAIYITEKLTKVKFIITEEQSTNIISCTGLGLINKNVK
ncbi:RNA 3'-terminal phosphate cyclase [Arctopsyche grandis]|uniref:RNA 3'-terminal phosphate cyclase n=1 Tax=Arctopsyche grandis TaxID=121162 RepID=UPI00406D6F45